MSPNEKSTASEKLTLPENVWPKVAVPALVTLFLGLMTVWIDHRVSERAQKEQDARLYTELMSRREQASSELRKDMFATILSGFLAPSIKGDGNSAAIEHAGRDIDGSLLKLELLALNFGESLSLGPLFAMMDRQIRTDSSYATTIGRLDRPRYRSRLESLARRVADAQRGALAGQSDSFRIEVPQTGETGHYEWPDSPDANRLACLVLRNVQRRFGLKFTNPDHEARSVRVSMRIETMQMDADAPQGCFKPFEECQDLPASCSRFLTTEYVETTPFTIDYFNLPMVDNSVLSYDQRFALAMRDFKPSHIEVVGVLFPGEYAARRDKLTVDQAIAALRSKMQ